MNIFLGYKHILELIINKKCMFVFLILVFIKLSSAQVSDTCNCATIDFENIPGDSVYEGLIISTQYLDSLGITFVLEDSTFPHIADVGGKITAFESSYGGDTPAPGQNIGSFFLTDDGLTSGPGITTSPLIINFPVPVDSASGVILDIDATENFKIQARNCNGNVIHEITIIAGDPGTGDGLATVWSIKRESADICSIRLEGKRTQTGFFGLGFDNFTSCSPLRTTVINKNIINNIFPIKIVLYNNFPNPFNSNTTIEFTLSQAKFVTIKIFNIFGEEVTTLVSDKLSEGSYSYDWDASNMASGLYLYRMEADDLSQSTRKSSLPIGQSEQRFVATGKMILIK